MTGWKKCVHEAAAFDSQAEYAVACTLDSSANIDWWFRNDPALLRIPTQIGFLEPDFVYKRKTTGTDSLFGVLEVKGDIFWDAEGSDPRVKAAAASNWAQAASTSTETQWEFGVILEQDAKSSTSVEELRKFCVVRWPL